MPVNFNVGAVSRFVPASAPVTKRESVGTAKSRTSDGAEFRLTSAPEPAELTLAGARAEVASLRDDMTARPRAARAAQANVRPRIAIVLNG